MGVLDTDSTDTGSTLLGGDMKDLKDLIDRVLDQIKKDVEDGDLTAVAEMLTHVANKHLEGYLPERLDDWTYSTKEKPNE